MKTETVVLNEKRNVVLSAYLLPVGGEFREIDRRPSVLILPGGGYQYCSEREAEPVAMAYLKAGFHAFILNYSIREHAKWPNPLNDCDDTISFIRSKAQEWALYPDKIAVVGFSAGGHLAAAAATMAEHRPNAAILGYPVINEATAKMCEKTAPDISEQVDSKTPPCFLFATRTDEVVPVENSVQMMSALLRHNISFESHIYSFGSHGFSTAEESLQCGKGVAYSERVSNWVGDSIGWLKEVFGEFRQGGLSEPKVNQYAMPVDDGHLSVNCTIERVRNNVEGARTLDEYLTIDELQLAFTEQLKAMGASLEMMTGGENMVSQLSVKNALSMALKTADEIEELNKKLRQIEG